MKIYRRKQTTVTAIQYDGTDVSKRILANESGCFMSKHILTHEEMLMLDMEDPEVVHIGDWVVRDEIGDYHLYKPEEFYMLFAEI